MVVGKYSICPECLEKKANYNARHRSDPAVLEADRIRRKARYYEHKKNGICVDCDKKATHGLFCYECHLKRKRRNAEYAEKKKLQRAEGLR